MLPGCGDHPRSQAYWIATEYGAVNLAGRSTWERAEALISIAHPDFREELIKHAREQRIWLPRRSAEEGDLGRSTAPYIPGPARGVPERPGGALLRPAGPAGPGVLPGGPRARRHPSPSASWWRSLLGCTICKNLFSPTGSRRTSICSSCPGRSPFKTKLLSKQIGSARRVLAAPSKWSSCWTPSPGSASVLGLMNDTAGAVAAGCACWWTGIC